MGSVVLKLQLTTRNSCLLFLLPFSAWLWPSLAMATMVMDMAMVMDMDMAMVTMDTMERDLLKPSQDMDIMASAPLSQLPLLSQLQLLSQLLLLNLQPLLSLDIFMVMDMVMDTILAMDMVDMDFMDSMARDLLSQDMDT